MPDRHPLAVQADLIESALVDWFEEKVDCEVEYDESTGLWMASVGGEEIALSQLAGHVLTALVPKDQLLHPLPRPRRPNKPMGPDD